MTFFSLIRDMTKERQIELPAAPSLRALLHVLADRYDDAFRAKILEGDDVSGELIVLVNGRHIAHTGGGDTPLKEGDEVSIFPVVGGG
ncbi:MoaD family protein [Aminiphilus sp.]|uniref:MoaD/ThiS family protein n=1 Tax=Aminiphilus sp. TaxID=1872488 RepID=UPI0026064E1B|nr:MoaD family protein [Aminiphilus sp.]